MFNSSTSPSWIIHSSVWDSNPKVVHVHTVLATKTKILRYPRVVLYAMNPRLPQIQVSVSSWSTNINASHGPGSLQMKYDTFLHEWSTNPIGWMKILIRCLHTVRGGSPAACVDPTTKWHGVIFKKTKDWQNHSLPRRRNTTQNTFR